MALTLLGLLLLPPFMKRAFCSNFHEHYSSLASYSDYRAAFRSIGQDLDQIPFGELSEDASGAIQSIFEKERFAKIKARLGPIDPASLSFDQLSRQIQLALSPRPKLETVKRAFFEFNALNAHTPASLEEIGWNIRTETQKRLAKSANGDGLIRLFENWANRVPLRERTRLDLSASAKLFRDDRLPLLKRLRALFIKKGTDARFFFQIQRKLLIYGEDEEFKDLLKKINSSALTGELDGVDLVGSLHEGQKKRLLHLSRAKANETESRLNALIRTLHDYPATELRIHAFEAPAITLKKTNLLAPQESRFYTALKSALESAAKNGTLPERIRIGHIAGLREEDIRFFETLKKNSHTQIAFDANIKSNILAHGASEKDLAATINRLDHAGFPVLLGTDGEGILGGKVTRIEQTLISLKKAGLEPEVAERIIRRAAARTTSYSAPMTRPFARECLTQLLKAIQ